MHYIHWNAFPNRGRGTQAFLVAMDFFLKLPRASCVPRKCLARTRSWVTLLTHFPFCHLSILYNFIQILYKKRSHSSILRCLQKVFQRYFLLWKTTATLDCLCKNLHLYFVYSSSESQFGCRCEWAHVKYYRMKIARRKKSLTRGNNFRMKRKHTTKYERNQIIPSRSLWNLGLTLSSIANNHMAYTWLSFRNRWRKSAMG